MSDKIRILVAKSGLDGHDRGAKVVASTFRDAGFEVIYTGLRQTAEMIVEAAIQEDVDVIAVSILSGAHMTVFPKVLNLMKENDLDDVLLTGGGIMSDKDINELMAMGVGRLFGPGASLTEAVGYIKDWYSNR
jgi:methylmalonyl-CoA mutase C-terminal domain/subunit